jgi:hypothetical protein
MTNIPAWMTNAEICQYFEVSDAPNVSLDSLRVLWNMLHPKQENHDFFRTPSPKSIIEGEGHEEKKNHNPTNVSIRTGREFEPATIGDPGKSPAAVRPDGNGTVPADQKGGENG